MLKYSFEEYVAEYESTVASLYEKKYSEDKKNCLLFYDSRLMYKELEFANFIIFMKKNDMNFEQYIAEKNVFCWFGYGVNSVKWSNDSKYCILSISIINEKKNIWLSEAKLIIDIDCQKYTVIPLAGARNYGLILKDGARAQILPEEYNENEYISIKKKEIDLKSFKWFPLLSFHSMGTYYYNGKFGNIAGYSDEEKNIYFKNSKNEWPYDDI